MGLRTILFDTEILIDKELEAILGFGGLTPIVERDILVFPSCAFERQARLGNINLVIGQITFPNSIAQRVSEGGPALLHGAIPAIEEHVSAAH